MGLEIWYWDMQQDEDNQWRSIMTNNASIVLLHHVMFTFQIQTFGPLLLFVFVGGVTATAFVIISN